MSNNCLAGFPAFGPRVDTKITYHTREIVLDPAFELPTSDPVSGNFQITVGANDLPSFSPYVPPPISDPNALFSDCYVTMVVIKVHNSTGASIKINERHATSDTPDWTSLVQSKNVAAGSDVSYVYAAAGHQYPQMRLWAAAAGLTLVSAHLVILPRYIGKGLAGVKDLVIELSEVSLTGYTVASTWGWSQKVNDGAKTSTAVSYVAAQADAAMGFGYPVMSFAWGTIASAQPRYPTRIAYTPIL